MSEAKNKICILLLIGLPGSGKSYLTNFLANHFENSLDNFKCNVLPFSYDELMPTASNCENLKDKRKEILNTVQNMIEKLKFQNNACDKTLTKDFNESPEMFNTCTLIVIDDNMYYRSMRYEYFKLSKVKKVGFCQIFIEATLDQSLSVNYKRDNSSRVPEVTISRMNNLIQIPDKANHWEKLTMFIPFHTLLKNSEIMHKIECLIKEALLTSIESYGSDDPSSAGIENQNSNTNSLVHLVDISLRCLIRNNIKSFMRSNKGEVRRYAEELNARKLNILNDLRTKILILPENLVEAFEDQNPHNKDLINNFLQNLLTSDA